MEETGSQVDDASNGTHTLCLVVCIHVETFAFTQQAHEHSGKEAKEEKERERERERERAGKRERRDCGYASKRTHT